MNHAPIYAYNTVKCSACDYQMWAGGAARGFYESMFQKHADQYLPGRAPDIEVEYVVSATCSVCEDGGDVDTNDSDSVVCGDCGTTWSNDGKWGERE